jgi:hypothetical protein
MRREHERDPVAVALVEAAVALPGARCPMCLELTLPGQ